MASIIKCDTLQSTTSNVFVLNSAGTEYARFHTTDGITFSNGGAERVRITNDGNVGIGTTGPSNFGGTNLQVANTNIASVVWTNGTYTGQLLASASAEVTVGSRSNHVLRFATNDTERARIDTSGNFKLSSAGTKVLNSSGNPILQQTGSVLQVVNVQSGAVATTTTLLPGDDTIPQITEGAEFLTLAITPTSSTSKLRIDVIVYLNHSVSTAGIYAALFRDSTADALAAAASQVPNSGGQMPVCITHYATSGTTSSTTFRVRGGSGDAGTVTFNGNSSGSRKFGGAYASTITITEIAA